MNICKPSLKFDMNSQKTLIREDNAENFKNYVNSYLDAVIRAYDEIDHCETRSDDG